jgi:hypothetical protein
MGDNAPMTTTEPAKFQLGQTVHVRENRQWLTGIIIDLFVAPLSGQWVYVVGANGYYAEDVAEVQDDPA